MKTLYSFVASDGEFPAASLVEGTDGSLYGTTYGGGANQAGAVFQITPDGNLTTLHSFRYADGANPRGGLVQATDGSFYGTTSQSGPHNLGTVFRLSVGLAPFVKTVPHGGKTGSAVKILGTNLAGTSSFSFHGVGAAFTVLSPTEIATTVPAGATTGSIQVSTHNGTFSSGGPFLVIQ